MQSHSRHFLVGAGAVTGALLLMELYSSSYFERVIDVEVNVKQKNRLQKNTSFVAAAENPRIDCEYSKSAS